jgi:NAD-dependent dihydropyrimidine dehydrogenase PreA subunit
VTYVIAEPCVDVIDKACIEECPVDCIYEGGRMLYIHPDECVDCGACEPVCPVEAIFYEDDLPEKWRDYTAANVDFFDTLGSPGGASKVGKTRSSSRTCRRRPRTSGYFFRSYMVAVTAAAESDDDFQPPVRDQTLPL